MLFRSGGTPCPNPTIARPRFARVEDAEATGKVAEIFADIKRTKNIDFVPRFWQVIATNPVQLELVWTSLKSLMHPEAVGRVAAARPDNPRDHRAGRLGNQWLSLLHQLAHRGPAQARCGSRNPRRDHGHRGALQHDQRPGQRLPGRARCPAADGLKAPSSQYVEWPID